MTRQAPVTTVTKPLYLPEWAYLEITTRPDALPPTELHRYVLHRRWARTCFDNMVGFIGMNPSSASANVNDATAARCERFAHAWGYDGFVMTNVVSLRATSPKDLEAYLLEPHLSVRNEVNLDQIIWGLVPCRKVILCCGKPSVRKQALAAFTEEMVRVSESLKLERRQVHCLGVTGSGYPRHPLYLRKDTQPEPLPDGSLRTKHAGRSR